jgi:hypothetical protein
METVTDKLKRTMYLIGKIKDDLAIVIQDIDEIQRQLNLHIRYNESLKNTIKLLGNIGEQLCT